MRTVYLQVHMGKHQDMLSTLLSVMLWRGKLVK